MTQSVLANLQNNPWGTLWSSRRYGGIGLLAGFALAFILCFVLPPKYEARMTVGPAGRGAGADLSAFLPASESPTIQYLLQRVGSVTAADFAVYETLMTSPRVASALQKDEAFKGRLASLCHNCDTDSSALARWLECHLHSRPLGATQMRRIILRMRDGNLATDLLRGLHRLSDETIRADARIRTDQRIQYLRAQMAVVNSPDHRDALIGLLKEQERTRMMVGIDHDFSAEAIDPPVLNNRRVFPDPFLFLPVLGFLGFIGGLLWGLRIQTGGFGKQNRPNQ